MERDVRYLATNDGVRSFFDQRGDCGEGFEEPVRVYEVRWRE
jgi:hypothetical protein